MYRLLITQSQKLHFATNGTAHFGEKLAIFDICLKSQFGIHCTVSTMGSVELADGK